MKKLIFVTVMSVATLAGTAFAKELPRTIPTPNGTTPIDAVARRQALLDAYPNAAGFRLLDARGKKLVTFSSSDDVAFHPPNAMTDLEVSTSISALDGNRICLAEADNWSGVCIYFFEKSDGSMLCSLRFGNGAGKRSKCSIIPY